MATPLPDRSNMLLLPPDAAEAQLLARGIVSAIAPSTGLTQLQGLMAEAITEAMTGHEVDIAVEPMTAAEFAEGMAPRSELFRTRILQMMILGALVLRPIPPEVTESLDRFAEELMVGDDMLRIAHEFSGGCLGLAAFDFDRAGYMKDWTAAAHESLHTSRALESAWQQCVHDDVLADQWRALEDLPPGTLGRRITEFYRARGFHYPGTDGSAPPLLAQHDWVHLLADFGTQVESEIEVFAFIARANDDPRGFSLLAMVVSLFETGYLRAGAGLFESFPGQLSRDGVAIRLADALRRGSLVSGSVDFLEVDWFELADHPIDDVRQRFGVVPKSAKSIAAGSVGPWAHGGISAFQAQAGQAMAENEGRLYESFGATIA